ncbi:hypothetical protein ACR31U_34915 (plasmid) [Streptomyces rochei]|uniref:hypothetical protein n=1 Tax=Streptomyces TaxID=1883 RepID=UPI000FCB99A4|nr:hypothetical protein [Streptomyces sp. WAC05458]
MTCGDAEAAGQVVQQMWQGLPQEMSQEMPEGSPAGISLGAGQTRRDHQRRRLPEPEAYSASPGADPDDEAAGAGDGCAGRGMAARSGAGANAAGARCRSSMWAQARQEVTGLGLGELAGTSFVGERQGVLMASRSSSARGAAADSSKAAPCGVAVCAGLPTTLFSSGERGR